MRGSTAKDIRRQIRRSVGAEGLTAINDTTAFAYGTLAPSLQSQAREITRLWERLDRLDASYARFTHMDWKQRLRWLVFRELPLV